MRHYPLVSEWAVTLVCDATGATQPVECSYMKTIGTSYTDQVSEDMAISAGVSAEISVRNLSLDKTCFYENQLYKNQNIEKNRNLYRLFFRRDCLACLKLALGRRSRLATTGPRPHPKP